MADRQRRSIRNPAWFRRIRNELPSQSPDIRHEHRRIAQREMHRRSSSTGHVYRSAEQRGQSMGERETQGIDAVRCCQGVGLVWLFFLCGSGVILRLV